VCYCTRNAAGKILLLVIYAKSVWASISGAVLKQIKEMLDHDD
jgi:cation transporter-like permease